ncbi:hypothetical protein KKE26_00765 [bacterium]|nr:hypothetical protein [bacterium]MBU1754247.1 hypothetical protein [bacterium]
MKNKFVIKNFINSVCIPMLILVFIFALSSGCFVRKSDVSISKQAVQYPVKWYESSLFKIGSDNATSINTKDQLRKLLSMKWYQEIEVISPSDTTQSISVCTCEQFLEIERKKFEPKKAYEANAYMALATMSHAVKEIINAKSASVSFLRYMKLNKKTPDIFPAEMACIPSTTERKRLLSQKKRDRWSEVNQIKAVKSIDNLNAVYYDMNGVEQEIEIIGYGDFNHDGIDDILLLVQNSVTGGSYFTMSLFILTKRSSHATYEVIMEYNLFD